MTTDKSEQASTSIPEGPDIVNPASPEAVAAAKAEVVGKLSASKFDPSALQRAFDATTRTGQDAMSMAGGDVIPRKRIEFIVDVSELAPGVFPEDIKITLIAPTSAMEVKATEASVNPGAVGVMTVKASLLEMNGAPVPADQVDWLWEALGPGGRQIVATAFQEIGGLTPVGLGKAVASYSVR